MTKCLRCGAGPEFLQGSVPKTPRDEEIKALREEVERLQAALLEAAEMVEYETDRTLICDHCKDAGEARGD